jgi:hypothetical protein
MPPPSPATAAVVHVSDLSGPSRRMLGLRWAKRAGSAPGCAAPRRRGISRRAGVRRGRARCPTPPGPVARPWCRRAASGRAARRGPPPADAARDAVEERHGGGLAKRRLHPREGGPAEDVLSPPRTTSPPIRRGDLPGHARGSESTCGGVASTPASPARRADRPCRAMSSRYISVPPSVTSP